MEEDDLERTAASTVLSVLYFVWLIPFAVLLFFELWFVVPSSSPDVLVYCSEFLKVFISYHAIFLGISLLGVLFYFVKFLYFYVVTNSGDSVGSTDSSYDNDTRCCRHYFSPKKLLIYFICLFSAVFCVIGITIINSTKSVCTSTAYFNLAIIIVIIPVVLLLIFLAISVVENLLK